MKLITRDSELYDELYQRQIVQFVKWTNKGQPGGDLEMYGLTKALFRIPGCVPRFSCESHPTKDSPDRFYVMLLAKSYGHRHLTAILNEMMTRRAHRMSGPCLSLIQQTNHACVGRCFCVVETSILEAALSVHDKREFLWELQSVVNAYADSLDNQ